jgi:hypothetical protein
MVAGTTTACPSCSNFTTGMPIKMEERCYSDFPARKTLIKPAKLADIFQNACFT